MKKILAVVFLLAVVLPAWTAEQVATISFNPSRLGQYKYLKINKDANLKGGLSVANDGELVFAASNGGAVNITGPGLTMEMPRVFTKSGATGVNISMANTAFQKAGTVQNYTRGASISGTPLDLVEMTGGAVTMSGTASYVNNLNNNSGNLNMVSNNIFQADKNVTVSGAAVTTTGGSESGMVLGNIRVGVPSSSFNRYGWKWLEGATGRIRVLALCNATDAECDAGANVASAPSISRTKRWMCTFTSNEYTTSCGSNHIVDGNSCSTAGATDTEVRYQCSGGKGWKASYSCTCTSV